MSVGSNETAAVFGSVVLAVILLGAAGCGHSEEEWEAMLHQEQVLRQRCAAGPPDVQFGGETETSRSSTSCGSDVDCKGDRICNAGRCTPQH